MEIGQIQPGSAAKAVSFQKQIDEDTVVTLGLDDLGYYSEVYTGENYVVGSTKRSYSRIYRDPHGLSSSLVGTLMFAPAKYGSHLNQLKEHLVKKLANQ